MNEVAARAHITLTCVGASSNYLFAQASYDLRGATQR